jgi:hypothetical protein
MRVGVHLQQLRAMQALWRVKLPEAQGARV